MQSYSQIVATNIPSTNFLQVGCPPFHPTNSVRALNGKISQSMDLLTPSSPGGLSTLSLTTEGVKGAVYLGERVVKFNRK